MNMVAAQDRVYGEELPTDGYATLRLYGSYSFTRGGVLNTLTARLENATNELYRNHLNYLKDQLPEMGRLTFRGCGCARTLRDSGSAQVRRLERIRGARVSARR